MTEYQVEAPTNEITCYGLSVSSSTETLKEVEACFDRLVKKHKKFIQASHKLKDIKGYV